MTSSNVLELLRELEFERYDSISQTWVVEFQKLISIYDYDDVCAKTNQFVINPKNYNFEINNKIKWFESIVKFSPKKSEKELIELEKKERKQFIKEYTDIMHSLGEEDFHYQEATIKSLQDHSKGKYANYPYSYLRSVAKKNNCSIHHLCELRALQFNCLIR